MAREFAKVRLSIWDDDDFRDITPAEQHLYFVLLTSYELTYCGVGDWRPARIAGHAKGWAAEQVVATAAGLIEKLYLVVDDATEEVLVRSFIRHDEILKQPKMAIAMARAHAKVASSTLRGVIVHELNRLHAEEPDLKGWSEKAVLDLLPKSSVDPSTYPLGKGSGWGSGKGSGTGSGSGNSEGSGWGSGNPPATTLDSNHQPSTPNLETNSLRSLGASAPRNRAKPKRHLPDDWTPNDAHRAYAAENGIDVDHEAGQFRSHAESKDRQQVDWDAAFRNWLGNNVKWDQPRTPWAAGPVVDGFQLPPAPKEIIDNPDATAYVRWARAQRDEWLAAQNGSPA
jgi:hypothetical protein